MQHFVILSQSLHDDIIHTVDPCGRHATCQIMFQIEYVRILMSTLRDNENQGMYGREFTIQLSISNGVRNVNVICCFFSIITEEDKLTPCNKIYGKNIGTT